jgi:hypothetical protein
VIGGREPGGGAGDPGKAKRKPTTPPGKGKDDHQGKGGDKSKDNKDKHPPTKPSGSTKADKILDNARKNVGYHEGPNNRNKWGPTGQPWCAYFATSMWRGAGVNIPDAGEVEGLMDSDERSVDELIEIAEEMPERMGIAARMADIRGTAQGAGISLSVDMQGMLVGLELADEALVLGAGRLAMEISRLTAQASTAALREGCGRSRPRAVSRS